MPEKILAFIEDLIDIKLYPSRNEAIRMALRNFVEKESIFLSNLNLDMEKLHYLHQKYVELDNRLKDSILTTRHRKTRESIISTAKKIKSRKNLNDIWVNGIDYLNID